MTRQARSSCVPHGPTPALDRRNGIVFLACWLLIYVAAPVVYVGVVQAALLDKLGASATVANLPASVYVLGSFTPIVLARFVPLRLEPAIILWTNGVTAVSLAAVGAILVLPVAAAVQIGVVIAQSLLYGLLGAPSGVYLYQCLGRGTSEGGRTKALKLTFTLGPLAAVAGSLGSQLALNHGIPGLAFPGDFALLYLTAAPVMGSVALVSRRFELPEVEEPVRPPLLGYLKDSSRAYIRSLPLTLLWVGYWLWYCSINAMPNLSLYAKQAVGRDPKELSGIVNAARFGFKSAAGWAFGAIAGASGARTPLIVSSLLLAAAVAWTWTVPGYPYLLAFGLMGAGELGGAYFFNFTLALSTPATGARNLAILSLATPASSIAPVINGMLTDRWGFPASFLFAIATAALALGFILRLPARPSAASDGAGRSA